MAATNITFGTKILGEANALPENKKLTFTNANEIKDVVNNNATELNTTQGAVATNTSGIATNTSDISANTSGVSNNSIQISTNTSNIATNTSGIATNTSNVSTNITNIQANVASLALKADLVSGRVPSDQLPEFLNTTTLLHSTSTGLSSGGLLSINTDNTKFDISGGLAYRVNGHSDVENPTSTKIDFNAITGITPQFLSTHNASYVALDSNGAVFQTAVPLSPTEKRNYVRLGVIVHPNRTFIFVVNNQPTINVELGGQVQDILDLLGFRSKSGNRILPNTATGMKIKKDAGVAFKAGANFDTLNTQPHSFTLAAQSPITFRYRLQNGVEGSDRTDLNPTIYDLNGVETAIPPTATLASVQQVYIFQEGDVRIQPGQRYYNNLTEAVTGLNSAEFITEENIANNGLYLGSIVMIYGTTDLANILQAVFVPSQGTTANGSVAYPPLGYTPEDVANKQDSLVVDGTGAKYATVDAVNTGLDYKISKNLGATYTTNALSSVTQAEYDALTPVATTVYFIV